MARQKKSAVNGGANLGFEATIWPAVDARFVKW
jgi:hypothetical protein